jgi:hypothetical protein
MRIVEELISFYRHIYLNLPGVTRLVGVAGAGAALRFGVFPANLYKLGEPTSGLEPLSCSLRVIGHVLRGLAQECKSRISKRVSILWFAARCTALRSRWYQSGIRTSDSYSLTAGPMARTRDLRSHNPNKLYRMLPLSPSHPAYTSAGHVRLVEVYSRLQRN